MSEFSLDEWIKISEALNPLRREIRELEDKINKMMNGELFDGFCRRGLETFRIREMEHLWKKYPQARDLIIECLKKHKELYERLYGVPLDHPSLRLDECVQNVRKMLDKFAPKFSLLDYIRERQAQNGKT